LYATIRLELHDLALEDLHLKAVELEDARDRVAKRAHLAAMLERGVPRYADFEQ
jgi:hypothetical protein